MMLDDRLGAGAQFAFAAAHHLDRELARKFLQGLGVAHSAAVPARSRVYFKNARCMRSNRGPGRPLPTGKPSRVVTGSTPRVANASQISSAARNCASLTVLTSVRMLRSPASSVTTSRVVPGRMLWLLGGV